MSVRAKLLISYGAMTGLVVAMAGITAFVSYLHTQHDPGAGSLWLTVAVVMAVTGVVA